jgi:gamma-glutamyl:cysteine ligase YbdK (ATP-grasp superfamily)
VIFRFDRSALEVRVMDEQECVKSDVALSCFIRAILRGIWQQKEEFEYLSHNVLVSNLHAVIRDGLDAFVQHPKGSTARQVCHYLHKIAEENASSEEKKSNKAFALTKMNMGKLYWARSSLKK